MLQSFYSLKRKSKTHKRLVKGGPQTSATGNYIDAIRLARKLLGMVGQSEAIQLLKVIDE